MVHKDREIRSVSVDVQRRTSIGDFESLLARYDPRRTADAPEREWQIRLAVQDGGEILADVWAAIAMGTICRGSSQKLDVAMWGTRSPSLPLEHSGFFNTLAGLTCAQMANRVVTDVDHELIDVDQLERFVSLERGGLLEDGSTRTLVEFDPQQPVAQALFDQINNGAAARRRLFSQLVLKFRRDLEIGGRLRGFQPVGEGAAGDLGVFLAELHENGYEHGRLPLRNTRSERGIRFLRLKKHLGKKSDLLRRAGDNPHLREFVDRVISPRGTGGVVEAIVSDFGSGIVDHFLSSPLGRQYQGQDRRKLLDMLIASPLSAKSDPAAGRGIMRALRAARAMGGYVSLRTAEFWLALSFEHPQSELEFKDVRSANARVVGTHWQFLWPQPL